MAKKKPLKRPKVLYVLVSNRGWGVGWGVVATKREAREQLRLYSTDVEIVEYVPRTGPSRWK